MDSDAESRPVRIVDCDVHPVPKSLEEFLEFYPEPFRSRYFAKHLREVPLDFQLYTPTLYRSASLGGYAAPPTGGGGGSDPDFAARQLCVDTGIDYLILNPLFFRPRHWDPEWDKAHAAALNNWLAA